MAAKKKQDQVSAVIHEVEALAKRLRTDVRKAARATGVDKQIRSAARQLRKRAAHAAEQVEKYVHQVRVDLQGAKPRSRRKRSPARRRATARRAA